MDGVAEVPEAVVRAAEELYGLPPGDFTARRTTLAGELRKAGDRPAATAVAALRRPTVAAWLVNRLARDDDAADAAAGEAVDGSGRALLDRLLDLGEQTRQAQAALDGARIRELGRGRQPLVAGLVRRAAELGEQDGQQVAAGVQRELEETFGAAIADPAAAAAVASGMLTRALAYAGLGDVDLDAATALVLPPGSALAPRPPRAPAKRRHLAPVPDAPPDAPDADEDQADDAAGRGADAAARRAERRRAERRRAEQAERAEQERAARQAEQDAALARARADAEAAEQALAASLEKQQQAQDRERDLTRTVDRLQDELAQARRDLVTASHAVGAAERDVIHRERAARETRKALTRAEQSAADAAADASDDAET